MKKHHLLKFHFLKAKNLELGIQVTETKFEDKGIFVSHILHNGAAARDGRILIGDELLYINGSTLVNKTLQEAVSILQNATSPIQIVIKRETIDEQQDEQSVSKQNNQISSSKPGFQEVTILKAKGKGLGIGFSSENGGRKNGGIFVKYIAKGSSASKQGLRVKDEIIQVNEMTLENISLQQFYKILMYIKPGPVKLTVHRHGDDSSISKSVSSFQSTPISAQPTLKSPLFIPAKKKKFASKFATLPSKLSPIKINDQSIFNIGTDSIATKKSEVKSRTDITTKTLVKDLAEKAKNISQRKENYSNRRSSLDSIRSLENSKTKNENHANPVLVKEEPIKQAISEKALESVPNIIEDQEDDVNFDVNHRYLLKDDVRKSNGSPLPKPRFTESPSSEKPKSLRRNADLPSPREIPSDMNVQCINIPNSYGESLGISLVKATGNCQDYFQVRQILSGSLAEINDQIRVGDCLYSMNGVSMKNMSHPEALTLLKQPNEEYTFVIFRPKEIKKPPITKKRSILEVQTLFMHDSDDASEKSDKDNHQFQTNKKIDNEAEVALYSDINLINEADVSTINTRSKNGVFCLQFDGGGKSLGIKVMIDEYGCCFITEILKKSPFYGDKRICVGDQLIGINEMTVQGKPISSVNEMISSIPRGVIKLFLKSPIESDVISDDDEASIMSGSLSDTSRESLTASLYSLPLQGDSNTKNIFPISKLSDKRPLSSLGFIKNNRKLANGQSLDVDYGSATGDVDCDSESCFSSLVPPPAPITGFHQGTHQDNQSMGVVDVHDVSRDHLYEKVDFDDTKSDFYCPPPPPPVVSDEKVDEGRPRIVVSELECDPPNFTHDVDDKVRRKSLFSRLKSKITLQNKTPSKSSSTEAKKKLIGLPKQPLKISLSQPDITKQQEIFTSHLKKSESMDESMFESIQQKSDDITLKHSPLPRILSFRQNSKRSVDRQSQKSIYHNFSPPNTPPPPPPSAFVDADNSVNSSSLNLRNFTSMSQCSSIDNASSYAAEGPTHAYNMQSNESFPNYETVDNSLTKNNQATQNETALRKISRRSSLLAFSFPPPPDEEISFPAMSEKCPPSSFENSSDSCPSELDYDGFGGCSSGNTPHYDNIDHKSMPADNQKLNPPKIIRTLSEEDKSNPKLQPFPMSAELSKLLPEHQNSLEVSGLETSYEDDGWGSEFSSNVGDDSYRVNSQASLNPNNQQDEQEVTFSSNLLKATPPLNPPKASTSGTTEQSWSLLSPKFKKFFGKKAEPANTDEAKQVTSPENQFHAPFKFLPGMKYSHFTEYKSTYVNQLSNNPTYANEHPKSTTEEFRESFDALDGDNSHIYDSVVHDDSLDKQLSQEQLKLMYATVDFTKKKNRFYDSVMDEIRDGADDIPQKDDTPLNKKEDTHLSSTLEELHVDTFNDDEDFTSTFFNVRILREADRPLGLIVVGGKESGIKKILIKEIEKNSVASSSRIPIHSGDEIVKINGSSVVGASHSEVMRILKTSPPLIDLTLYRSIDGHRELLHHPDINMGGVSARSRSSSFYEGSVGGQHMIKEADVVEILSNNNPFTRSSSMLLDSFSASRSEHLKQPAKKTRSVRFSTPEIRRRSYSEASSISNQSSISSPSILRQKYSEFVVHLCKSPGKGLGIGVCGGPNHLIDVGIKVKRLVPGSISGNDGRLQPGDLIYAINSQPIVGLTQADALSLLKQIPSEIFLSVKRPLLIRR